MSRIPPSYRTRQLTHGLNYLPKPYSVIRTLLVSGLLMCSLTGFSQSGKVEGCRAKYFCLREISLLSGAGFGALPEGTYTPVLIMADFSYKVVFVQPGLGPDQGFLLYLDPQINLGYLNGKANIEAGVSLGGRYQLRLAEKFRLYGMMGLGPQYFSVETRRQASGLGFATSWGGGFLIGKGHKPGIHFQYRLRHLSNSGAVEPNAGINSHIFLAGIVFRARDRSQ